MTLRNLAGVPLAAVFAAALLAACSEDAQKTKILLTPVTVEAVVALDFEDRIEATGQLLAVERAEIAAEVDGQITELVIDEGSAAVQGDVILNIDPQHVDANLFCARATAGRSLMSAQPNEGRDALASALALWRGEPLLDVAYLPWAAAAIRRLNEVRVGACESLARANLAIGQGELAIAELESLTELHPLRESLWMLLWEALAQAGRHLEVMQSYRRFSAVLDREYSITPSTHLADAAAKFADSAGKQVPTS